MKFKDYDYIEVRSKLMPQMRACKDKDVRVKVALILDALKRQNVMLACQRMGVGRTSFYKWWNRLVGSKFKLSSLEEQSRRPHRSPRRTAGYIESRIFHYRRKGYGALMIAEYLRREGLKAPSGSVIQHILNKRKTPVKRRRAKLKKHRLRYELVVPGQRVQIDVKYVPGEVGGKRAYCYVAIDECTRWRFARAYSELNEHWTTDFLERLKRAMPFPLHTVQTDNGHEFTFKLLGGNQREHAMEAWCSKHGIRHRLIPPGVKELNGKVERSHAIDADYFYGRAPRTDLDRFNKALEGWIRFYNVLRPHGGLAYHTPAEKLRERIIALKTETVAEDIEPIRKKFVESVKFFAATAEKKMTAA